MSNDYKKFIAIAGGSLFLMLVLTQIQLQFHIVPEATIDQVREYILPMLLIVTALAVVWIFRASRKVASNSRQNEDG